MQVTLYKFAKRTNSTKRIDNNTTKHVVNNVTFKTPVSILNPTLMVTWNPVEEPISPIQYNYCYIPFLERYYFIKDWISVNNNIWQCYMQVDVLGTYKSSIATETHYVIRSASNSNPYIMDDKYIGQSKYYLRGQAIISNGYGQAANGGIYIVGIINSKATTGSVTYYALTQTQMGNLKQWLMTNPENYFTQANPGQLDVSSDTIKFLFNPYQYITSIMWYPFEISNISDMVSTETIYFGWWDTHLTGYRLTSFTLLSYEMASVNMHQHPDASSRGLYLNNQPFSIYRICYPPLGNFTLNGEAMSDFFNRINTVSSPPADISKLIFYADVDLITGIAYWRIMPKYVGTLYPTSQEAPMYLPEFVFAQEAQFGVPMTLASIMSNTTGANITASKAQWSAIGNIFSSITNGIRSVDRMDRAGTFANTADIGLSLLESYHTLKEGAYDALAVKAPVVEKVGSAGCLTQYDSVGISVSYHIVLVEENNDELGRPYYSRVQINTLSGYIQCSDARTTTLCTAGESHIINTFLNTGFFYE